MRRWRNTAMLRVNEAWAHAALGEEGQAVDRLREGREEFERRAPEDTPGWA